VDHVRADGENEAEVGDQSAEADSGA
jgi:hypothetical protein